MGCGRSVLSLDDILAGVDARCWSGTLSRRDAKKRRTPDSSAALSDELSQLKRRVNSELGQVDDNNPASESRRG